MQKIISLFQRDWKGDRLARNEITPGAEWVVAGEGVATRKWDGTCCLIRDGKLFKRYEVGKGKQPPPQFEAASEVDPVTGKQQGWVPVGEGPEDQWHRAAIGIHPDLQETLGAATMLELLEDGTYELIGPKVQGNPHGHRGHKLMQHGAHKVEGFPREFNAIRDYFARQGVVENPTPDVGEGVVWHHPDGRMVKCKKRDFFKE